MVSTIKTPIEEKPEIRRESKHVKHANRQTKQNKTMKQRNKTKGVKKDEITTNIRNKMLIVFSIRDYFKYKWTKLPN